MTSQGEMIFYDCTVAVAVISLAGYDARGAFPLHCVLNPFINICIRHLCHDPDPAAGSAMRTTRIIKSVNLEPTTAFIEALKNDRLSIFGEACGPNATIPRCMMFAFVTWHATHTYFPTRGRCHSNLTVTSAVLRDIVLYTHTTAKRSFLVLALRCARLPSRVTLPCDRPYAYCTLMLAHSLLLSNVYASAYCLLRSRSRRTGATTPACPQHCKFERRALLSEAGSDPCIQGRRSGPPEPPRGAEDHRRPYSMVGM